MLISGALRACIHGAVADDALAGQATLGVRMVTQKGAVWLAR
jgi:hypothetical protein